MDNTTHCCVKKPFPVNYLDEEGSVRNLLTHLSKEKKETDSITSKLINFKNINIYSIIFIYSL